jgi:hypothetical protein
MRIFISYSHLDKPEVDRIVTRLTNEGHDVWIDSIKLQVGDNIQAKIEAGIQQADALIVVISENSFKSQWVQHEFAAIGLQNISRQERPLFPIRIDKSPIPSYFENQFVLDLSEDFETGIERLIAALRLTNHQQPTEQAREANELDNKSAQLTILCEALRRGRLTLVCGAGVSVQAGIPAWNDLLLKLLERMMEKIADNLSLDLGKRAAEEFQKRNGSSSLILGKYLKNILGNDFANEMREVLYSSQPATSDLIRSILILSRPKRDGRPLDSIITFNFDSLIEENLSHSDIPNKAIFSDSVGHGPNVLPVYHVHGYLPRTGNIPEESQLVFSEDAYHTQFIDPFSWSNLIQLNKLTQNTCLFVGVSLTDPNTRRLLDVAWRKNPDKTLSHYLVKRLPTTSKGDVLDSVSKLLEEQDANALGLNIIWIKEFDEIANLLRNIAGSV